MVNIVTKRHDWAIQSVAPANVVASITRAAVAGGRHVCTSITASIGGTSQSLLRRVRLRDGASGLGTILWAGQILSPANDSRSITMPALSIVGSKNTAMTLEWEDAAGANTLELVSLTGYTETDVVQNTG